MMRKFTRAVVADCAEMVDMIEQTLAGYWCELGELGEDPQLVPWVEDGKEALSAIPPGRRFRVPSLLFPKVAADDLLARLVARQGDAVHHAAVAVVVVDGIVHGAAIIPECQ